jgi:hypothetical protein
LAGDLHRVPGCCEGRRVAEIEVEELLDPELAMERGREDASLHSDRHYLAPRL